MVSIAGIIINIIMVIIILVLIALGIGYSSDLNICETKQSPFCYTIHCPCDTDAQGKSQPPCFGYAKMPAEKEGEWYCSNAQLSAVDNNGNLV